MTAGEAALLEAHRLNLDAPGGRPLIRGLSLSLGRERAAVIGRNGVGKSTLLASLANGESVIRRTAALLVPQDLSEPAEVSPGERRKLHLERAREARPSLLLLDEPTRDLDDAGFRWLTDWLEEFDGGLVVVSHDRRLLRSFDRFFIVAESGCRCFAGGFDELERDLERERVEEERRYLQKLNVLAEAEEKNEAITRRRERKKRLGRLHEERRSPTSGQLHGNKSYAEASQGKAAKIRRARITAVREWVKSSRRALAVQLPLTMLMPSLPEDDGRDLIALDGVSVTIDDRALFEIDLHLKRSDRVGIVGPNGAGKTTLLEVMMRHADMSRIGSIAQGASDWRSRDSLLQRLSVVTESPDALARTLVAHKFPLALAERPLSSLSPGERVRAAFICLMQQPIEMLLLDEPTDSLDLLGAKALAEGLRAWPGGLVIATHDAEFLEAVGVQRILRLDRC